jgi:two-component system, OmpR family, response regulator RpaA
MENRDTRRILVVEDDETYRDMVKLRLELAGYEVVAASDGLSGLNLARKAHPDLVILDLGLPACGDASDEGGTALDRRYGHKICRMIKFDQKLRHTPVLILTCSDSAEDTALAVRSGADAYLMKTGDPGLFLKEVGKLTHNTRTVPLRSEMMSS